MKELPYPEVLPVLDPRWRTSDVLGVARGIRDDKAWERLPVLADALMDAGCEDEVIMEHLRGKRHTCPRCDGQRGHYFEGSWHKCELCNETGFVLRDDLHKNYRHEEAGCWQRECWLVNQLLGETQPLRAIWRSSRREEIRQDATAVNPGACEGKVWAVAVPDCYDPPVYIVEAEYISYAEEYFIDSDWGKNERIDVERDGDEWGYSEGVYGDDPRQLKYRDLNGNVTLNRLPEPAVTGSGNYYSSENIWLDEPSEVLYYGPGLPKEGVNPEIYAEHGPDGKECEVCGKRFWPTGLREYNCSSECNLKAASYAETD